MGHHFEFLKNLVDKGGSDVQDFNCINTWIAEIAEHARNGKLPAGNLKCLRGVLGDAIYVETIQGFVFQKPHGYAAAM